VTCRAGLFHSIYGTTAYHRSALPRRRRGELAAIIGAEAEQLVYRFADTSWPLVLNAPEVLAKLPAALCAIAAANIVEQYRRMVTGDIGLSAVRRALRPYLALSPYLVPIAAGQFTCELGDGG
jgi:hypothetical protein